MAQGPAPSPAATASAAPIVETPRWADAFVDSVGVNTHFSYVDTPYVANYATAASLLAGLHVRHIRDSATASADSSYYGHLAALAQTYGIHADLITIMNEPVGSITGVLAKTGSAPSGAAEFVEYPNEWDLNGGPSWAAGLPPYGQTLWTATLQFDGAKLIGPSLTSVEAYTQSFPAGTFAAIADYGNIHDYFGTYNPDTTGFGGDFPPYGVYGTIGFWLNLCASIEPTPVFATETGWDDGTTAGISVSAAVKARYVMRVLLNHWNAGIRKTYLYELLDEGGRHYGLLTGALATKASYTAIRNMLAMLGDPGSAPTLQPLSYTLQTSSTIEHTLLQKRDGSYQLLLWNAVPASDPQVAMLPVGIVFNKRWSSVIQYTWQDTGAAAPTVLMPSESNALTLNVDDRVTLLVLKP